MSLYNRLTYNSHCAIMYARTYLSHTGVNHEQQIYAVSPRQNDRNIKRLGNTPNPSTHARELTLASHPLVCQLVVAMKKIIAITLLAALVLSAVTIARPCPTEDSPNCTWYADVQGNGQGTSFIDIAGMVIYLK